MPKAAAAADDGIMTIFIDDRVASHGRAPKQAPTSKKKGKAVAEQPTELVRTPTLTSSHHTTQRPWQAVKLEPGDTIQEQLKTGCGLKSQATVKSYLNLLSTARRMCGGVHTVNLIKSPAECIAMIEQHASRARLSAHSVGSYMTAVLAAIKHCISCPSKAKLTQEIELWQKAHKKWQLIAAQPRLQNRASQRQQAGWVSYTDFCKVRDSLPSGSKERLLFGMYSYLPPCRADLGACLIIHGTPTAKQLRVFTGNYVCLQPPNSTHPSFLCLRQFKTARGYPSGVQTVLPSALVDEINASLQLHPRPYLFTQEYSPNKPYTRASFSKMASKVFQKHTGVPALCIQMIRHSYVTRALTVLDPSRLDACDAAGRALCEVKLGHIARSMCHSKEQQALYRFALKPRTGQPQAVTTKLTHRQTQAQQPAEIELLN